MSIPSNCVCFLGVTNHECLGQQVTESYSQGHNKVRFDFLSRQEVWKRAVPGFGKAAE